LDEWGQGPWFDPQGQGQEGEPANQPPANENAGELADIADTDFSADEPITEQEVEPGASGGFRMPPIPSRPLGPDRSYISGGPAGPAQWYSPPSGPFSQPVSQPRDMGGYGAPPRPAAGGGKGNGRRGRRTWLLLLALALLVLALSSTAGILTGYIPQLTGFGNHSGGPGLGILDLPTATATATALPTPTPLVPTAATITLTATSTGRSSSGSMTSCPHGCNILGNSYTSSKGLSGSYAASLIEQSHLSGTIHVVNNSTSTWSATDYQFSGGGYKCAGQNVSVPKNTSLDYTCFIGGSSPNVIPKGTIHGTPATNVTYTQPNDLVGDAHYQVLSGDCSAAFGGLHDQGKSWAQSWNAGLSVPSGWRLTSGSPKISYSGDSCPTGQQQTSAFNFTASSTTNARNAAYNPAAAQALASSRLDSTLPNGYAWLYSTRTTCSPSLKSVDGNNKVTLSCSDSGVAYYIWTSTAKSSLAGKIAGHSKSQALATCNKTTGVKSNSCSISIIGGDGSQMPQSAGALTIVAKTP
jgi:hypothetical protein